MARVYTITEAIGEIEAIRMESMKIPYASGTIAATVGQLADQNKELSSLVSELASVMGWLIRHLDHWESEILIPEIDETDADNT